MSEINDICRGRKPVLDLLTKTPSRCSKLLIANNVRPPFLDEVVDAAKNAKVTFQIVAPEALDKISGGEKHQGVICRLTQVKQIELEEFLRDINDNSPALVVVLDHIEDPHNLGAVIRSAEAGGACGVVYAKRRSAIPNDTVIKTSAGASLRLPLIQAVNITRSIETLKKFLSSRAARMAAILPSIMSEGATISAPASAWLTATFCRSLSVSSLST